MSEIVVQLENVNIYQSGNLILQDVNFTVQKGEFVYLVGKTGTGKSSLLKSLYGEVSITEGKGMVVGHDLKDMDWKKLPFLRRNLGVVFQDFQLLTDRNVHENLRFVLKATGWEDERLVERKIEDVLAKVGLQNKGFKMTYEMSGGEQQRVAIARALINNPDFIFLDEPTGNLDDENALIIQNLLLDVSKRNNIALVTATHDNTFIKSFDKIYYLKENLLLFSPKVLLNCNHTYHKRLY